jgi:hypothetical protein
MTSSYLMPTLTSIPGGYTFYSAIPMPRLLASLIVPDADIRVAYNAVHDGQCKVSEERMICVRDGALKGPEPAPFSLEDQLETWGAEPGFVEFTFESANASQIFETKRPLSFYSVYSSPGKKSFLTDNSYKFGSPPVIDQIAKFGRYNDSYPIVHIDRTRDIGESLILINPYRRAVVYQVVTKEGRKSPRRRLDPMTARYFRFEELMPDDETNWITQIQLTASNRLLTFTVKHSIANPWLITTHEHLDPFRADPTHMPATQWLRNVIGERLQKLKAR